MFLIVSFSNKNLATNVKYSSDLMITNEDQFMSYLGQSDH